ncbi:hypothetical protein ACWEOZ_11675 [Actinoplanes sp. NPDC004185]
MTVPNAGPQQPEHADADGADIRRGNPALVYRDESLTGGTEAASIRATVSHRFSGVRHPQTRSNRFPQAEQHPNDGGDPDASH